MIMGAQERIRAFENRQIAFSALALLFLLGCSIIANTLHMSSIAEHSTKLLSHALELEDFREVGVTLEVAKLDNFRTIRFNSGRDSHSFTLPPIAEFVHPTLWEKISDERVLQSTATPLRQNNSDSIVFTFNRFQLVPYAFLVWLALVFVSIPQTRFMKRRLVEQFDRDLALEMGQVKAALAQQVRHNLRTPLAALMRIPGRLPDSVKEDRELLKSSIAQIKLLISGLDGNASHQSLSKDASDDFYDSVLNAAREVALAVPPHINFSFEIDDHMVSAKIPHIPHELRAAIGNIVNNSIDAINGPGQIRLTARDLGPEVAILIEDTGRGIPAANIGRVFENGFSFGKAGGSGVGLFHAKKWVELWGGRVSIDSRPAERTTVSISFPIRNRAKWYVPRIKVSSQTTLVVLDDQGAARDLWRIRFLEAELSSQTHIFSTPTELEDFVRDLPSGSDLTFLLDYDLGSSKTGLELMKDLPEGSAKYLVTGHFDEAEIRNRCEQDNVYLLPKSEIAEIPIITTK